MLPMKILFALLLLPGLALAADKPTPQQQYDNCIKVGRKHDACKHYIEMAGMTPAQRQEYRDRVARETSKKATNVGKK